MIQSLKNTVRPVYHVVVRPIYMSAQARLDRARRYWRIKFGARQSPRKLVVGAEGIHQAGWIPTEMDLLNVLNERDWQRYFKEQSIDIILTEHMWHYLTEEQSLASARLCYRYLKPGGYMRMAVPDGLHPDPEYIEWVRPGGPRSSAKDHRLLYTYQTFRHAFEAAGFSVDLLEYYDEQGEFHFNEWDPTGGMIYRSLRYDHLKRPIKARYTSIILDAYKR
jgi:predicted SAM-dependent methyltransferase